MGNFDTKIAKIKTALENVFLKKTDAADTYQPKGNYATGNHTHTTGSITDFPSTMTPSSHTHGDITNDGKIGSTSGKPIITTTNGKLTTGNFGTGSGQFAEGNHTHYLDDLSTTQGQILVTCDGPDAYFLNDMLYFDSNNFTLDLFNTTTGDYEEIATKEDIPDISEKLDKSQTNYKGKNVVVDATSGNITFENKPTIPSKTSDLINDSNFITSHQDISGKEDTSNKVTSWSSTTTDTHYPSEKLVKDSLEGKANSSHTHTQNEITDLNESFLIDQNTTTTPKLNSSTLDLSSSQALRIRRGGRVAVLHYYFNFKSLASTSTNYNILASSNSLPVDMRPVSANPQQIIINTNGDRFLLTLQTNGLVIVKPYKASTGGVCTGTMTYWCAGPS